MKTQYPFSVSAVLLCPFISGSVLLGMQPVMANPGKTLVPLTAQAQPATSTNPTGLPRTPKQPTLTPAGGNALPTSSDTSTGGSSSNTTPLERSQVPPSTGGSGGGSSLPPAGGGLGPETGSGAGGGLGGGSGGSSLPSSTGGGTSGTGTTGTGTGGGTSLPESGMGAPTTPGATTTSPSKKKKKDTTPQVQPSPGSTTAPGGVTPPLK